MNCADCQTLPRAFRLSNAASFHVPVTTAELASPARNSSPNPSGSLSANKMISVISSGPFYGRIGPSSQVIASSSPDVPCSVASWSTVFQPTIWRCQLDCGPELVMARCSHTGPSPGS